jgi:hypothetical protein
LAKILGVTDSIFEKYSLHTHSTIHITVYLKTIGLSDFLASVDWRQVVSIFTIATLLVRAISQAFIDSDDWLLAITQFIKISANTYVTFRVKT